MKKITSLVIGDFKNTLRDTDNALMLLAPFLILIFVRFAVPFAAGIVMAKFNFDLTEYYFFIGEMMAMLTPMLTGFLMAYIIIDERDENILQFIMVTPSNITGYLKYRITIMSVFSVFTYLMVIIGSGLYSYNIIRHLPLAVIISLEAPIFSLAMSSFADNKVEGLAIGKGLGITLVAPVIAYFVKSKFAYIAGILPTFWAMKMAVSETTLSYVIFLVIALVMHIVFLYILVKLFLKRTY